MPNWNDPLEIPDVPVKKSFFPKDPFKKQTAGTTVLLTALSNFYSNRQFCYPVLNVADGKETIRSIRISSPLGVGTRFKYDPKDPFGQSTIWTARDATFGAIELNMFELHNFALRLYKSELRNRMAGQTNQAIGRAMLRTKFNFWSLQSTKYGVIGSIRNEVDAFQIGCQTFDPRKHKGVSGVSYLLSQGGSLTPTDLTQGIQQFIDMKWQHEGKSFIKYPPILTRWQLTAYQAQRPGPSGVYNVWVPTPVLEEDYESLLSEEYERGLTYFHPEDVEMALWYLTNPRRREISKPKMRKFADPTTGELVFLSQVNPRLKPWSVNLYEGRLGEHFDQSMLEKWANFGDFYGFDENTDQGLVGGAYLQIPDRTAQNEKTYTVRSKRIYLTERDLKNAGIWIDSEKPTVWWNPDNSLAGGIDTRHPQGLPLVLEWMSGMLWSNPIHLDRKTEKQDLEFLTTEIVDRLKRKADDLGIPYLGGQKPPESYRWIEDAAIREQAQAYFAKNDKSFESSDGDDGYDESEVDWSNVAPATVEL